MDLPVNGSALTDRAQGHNPASGRTRRRVWSKKPLPNDRHLALAIGAGCIRGSAGRTVAPGTARAAEAGCPLPLPNRSGNRCRCRSRRGCRHSLRSPGPVPSDPPNSAGCSVHTGNRSNFADLSDLSPRSWDRRSGSVPGRWRGSGPGKNRSRFRNLCLGRWTSGSDSRLRPRCPCARQCPKESPPRTADNHAYVLSAI
jgi:hypothetical protein